MCLQAQPAQRPRGSRSTSVPRAAATYAGQLRVLLATTLRGLSWGLPAVGVELRNWRARACTITDSELRNDALSALDQKRGHAAGAALFAAIPHRRHNNLLRLLVAYETIWDYLDSASERAPAQRNGRQLHLALIDALEPDSQHAANDYYQHHPWGESSYLPALIAGCREWCLTLPGYQLARSTLVTEAWRAQVLALNHEHDDALRDAALRDWAHSEAPVAPELSWYELTGAASASLTIHALLALAAQARLSQAELVHVRDTYNPWISAATTMLDSFVDQLEDAASGSHSYIAHYPAPQTAIGRTGWLIQQSIQRARTLPDGKQHALIVAAMAAMYLSKDSAADPQLRAASSHLANAGGRLTLLLLPLLRIWRTAYRQRAA